MQASVYRLRAAGSRLPRPAAPVQGELRLGVENGGSERTIVARLMGGTSHELLPALMRAQVRAVTANGMVIQGIEAHTRGQQKSRVRYTSQTWWAFILTEDALERFDGADPLRALDDEAEMRAVLGGPPSLIDSDQSE